MQFIEVNIELKKTVPYNEILIALLNDIKFNSFYNMLELIIMLDYQSNIILKTRLKRDN